MRALFGSRKPTNVPALYLKTLVGYLNPDDRFLNPKNPLKCLVSGIFFEIFPFAKK